MKQSTIGQLIVSQHEKKAVIFLQGIFSLADKTSETFDAAVTKLEAAGVKKAKVEINSGGGSVLEGIKMWNRAESSPIEFTKEVKGIAASMAAAFAAGGNIERSSKMMFHKPFIQKLDISVGASQMREIADMLDAYESQMVAMVTASTELSEEEVKAKYFVEGKDVWLRAKEAVDAGIMKDFIKETNVAASLQLQDDFYELDAVASYEVTAKIYKNEFKTPSIMELDVQAAAKELGLTAGATAADVMAELKNVAVLKKRNETLTAKVDELEAGLKTAKDATAVKLVADAIASGKILASEKDQFEADAKKDYDFMARMLDKIPAKTDLTKQLGGKASASDNRKDWDYNKWCDLDPKGIDEMQKSEPEKYQSLIDAYIAS